VVNLGTGTEFKSYELPIMPLAVKTKNAPQITQYCLAHSYIRNTSANHTTSNILRAIGVLPNIKKKPWFSPSAFSIFITSAPERKIYKLFNNIN